MTDPRGRVLVVDDDVAIRGFLSETLTDEGYEVRDASNGQEALATLDTWRAGVILLDLMMPVMDGWTFRERQLTTRSISQIPVVVMTAAHAVPDPRLAAVARFSKPFDLDALLDVVQRAAADAERQAASQTYRESAA